MLISCQRKEHLQLWNLQKLILLIQEAKSHWTMAIFLCQGNIWQTTSTLSKLRCLVSFYRHNISVPCHVCKYHETTFGHMTTKYLPFTVSESKGWFLPFCKAFHWNHCYLKWYRKKIPALISFLHQNQDFCLIMQQPIYRVQITMGNLNIPR